MKPKKAWIVLVAVCLVAVGGLSFYMGQQSATPNVENPPAESSTPKQNEQSTPTSEVLSDTVEYLQGDELTAYFQQIYDHVVELQIPQEHRLETELLFLPDMNATGKELPTDYEEQYLTWRPVDEVAEPEPSAPAESEAPVEPEVQETPNQKPTQSQSTSSNNSGSNNSVDADGDGWPDSWQLEDPGDGTGSSDHTDEEIDPETSGSNTNHDYSGITIGTSSNNQGNSSNSGSNSSIDANGDGWPDDWVLEDPGNGSGSSDHTDEEISGGFGEEGIDHSGITIG